MDKGEYYMLYSELVQAWYINMPDDLLCGHQDHGRACSPTKDKSAKDAVQQYQTAGAAEPFFIADKVDPETGLGRKTPIMAWHATTLEWDVVGVALF